MARKEWRDIQINSVSPPVPDDTEGGIVDGGGGGGGGLPTPAEGTPGGPAVSALAMTDSQWGVPMTAYTSGARLRGKFAGHGFCYMVVPDGQTETISTIDPAWDGNYDGSELNMPPFRSTKAWGFHDPHLYGIGKKNTTDEEGNPTTVIVTNNWDFIEWSVDGSTKSYLYLDNSARASFPLSVGPWDVLFTSKSWRSGDDQNPKWTWVGFGIEAILGRPQTKAIKPFFIVPSEPPANALPPSIWNGEQRLLKSGGTEYYTLDDISARLSLLPKMPKPAGIPDPVTQAGVAGLFPIPAWGRRSTSATSGNYDGAPTRYYNGTEQTPDSDAYGGNIASWANSLCLWLCHDFTDAEKLPVAAKLCSWAISCYDSAARFNDTAWVGTAGGGLSQGEMASIVFCGYLLGNSAMQNAYRDLPTGGHKERSAHEFNQIFYVPNDATEINYLSGFSHYAIRDQSTGKVIAGTPCWCERSYSNSRNPYYIGGNVSYQWSNNAYRQAPGALALNVAGLVDSVNWNAWFDYHDWWMDYSAQMNVSDNKARIRGGWAEASWDLNRATYGTRANYSAPAHRFK